MPPLLLLPALDWVAKALDAILLWGWEWILLEVQQSCLLVTAVVVGARQSVIMVGLRHDRAVFVASRSDIAPNTTQYY